MRSKVVVMALAAIASWAVVPSEADAFGHHRKRGRHHRSANACCTPQPVCQSVAPQYHAAPVQHHTAPGSCCGGQSYGGGAINQGSYPNDGGQYYEGGSGGYMQGQGYNSPQPQPYGNHSDPNQQGSAQFQGNTQLQGNAQGQTGLRSQGNVGSNAADANVGAGANVGTNGVSGSANVDGAAEGIGVGKADMTPDGGR